jgi:hypothetical protein
MRPLIHFFKIEVFSEQVSRYWSIYGGLSSIFRSIFLWLSIILTCANFSLARSGLWGSIALSVLPALIGFSIGAMAISLAIPSSALFKIIAEDGRKDSYYIDLSAKFVHFILIQVVAVTLAIFEADYHEIIFSFIGLFFLFYAVLTAIPTTFCLFGLAMLYNQSEISNNKSKKSDTYK